MKTVLDLQHRSLQIGRIRLGIQEPTGKTTRSGRPGMKPVRLSTFRFTSQSADAIAAAAAAFGGTPRPWENQGRREWEVITDASEIPVNVPPRDSVIGQAYERWADRKLLNRCNSQVQENGEPCVCPHAEDPTNAEEVAACALRRAEMARRNPPEACHLVTRVNVSVPDLLGWGVWRMDTGSFWAAGEMVDHGHLLEMAREAQVMIPAKLRIEQRMRGDGKPYPVPVLDILVTLRQLATGELEAGNLAAQLPPAPGQRLAITGGRRGGVQPFAAPPAQDAAERAGDDGPAPASPATPPAPPSRLPSTAQEVADVALAAKTRARMRPLFALAHERGWKPDMVCYDVPADDWEELASLLDRLWAELPEDQPATTGRQAPARTPSRQGSRTPAQDPAQQAPQDPQEDTPTQQGPQDPAPDEGLFADPNWATR